jgi:hypothetical protein
MSQTLDRLANKERGNHMHEDAAGGMDVTQHGEKKLPQAADM